MAKSVTRKAAAGIAWLYAEYGIQFACQSVALVILARMLEPKDFGIFAIGLMMVGIGETFFRMGLGPSIVQQKGSADGYLEVAWTANVALSLVAFVALAIFTPWINSAFFGAPEATSATIAMLLGIPLSSCINPASILLLKEMRYRQLFFVGLPRNVIRYGGAPIIALWVPTYWAMVSAYVAGFLSEAILSYVLLPNRARFYWNSDYFRKLYNFSAWIQLSNVVKWLTRYLDSVAIGNALGPIALGLYNRATTMASLPAQQVNMILFKVGFPLFASLQTDRNKTGRLAAHLLDLTTLTYFPIILTVLLFGEEVILLVLGPEWSALVPAMQVLVVAMYLRTLVDVLITVLRSNGHSRLEFTNNTLRIIVTGVLLYPLAYGSGMVGASLAVLAGSIAAVPSVLFWSARAIALDWRRVATSLFFSCALVTVVLVVAEPVQVITHGNLTLAGVTLCGGLTLAIGVMALAHFGFGIGPFGTALAAVGAVKERFRNTEVQQSAG